MLADTLTEALNQRVRSSGEARAVTALDDRGGGWTWAELDDRARRLATGLREFGVADGATVGLLLRNEPAFFAADLAVVLAGGVPVSVYATASPEQVARTLADAGARVVITSSEHLPLLRQANTPEHVVVVDGPLPSGAPAWSELLGCGRLDAHRASPDDILTIIYTSGTTGEPKGVELTHGAVMTAIGATGEVNGLGNGGRVASWLPMAHIAERKASYYAAVAFGLEVVTVADPRTILDALPEIRPTWFFSVPRVWEKLAAKAQALPRDLSGEQRLRALGLDALTCATVGAAPTPPAVLDTFDALGVPLLELYGMTENCACCTANRADRRRRGTTGVAMPGVELRIAGDGEVLMRSDTLMRGYRNRPGPTAEAFTAEGFLRTGDVGTLDADGFLRIVDRKKEILITSTGKNIAPSAVEAAVRLASDVIGHVCVIGDGRPYLTALITVDADAVAERSPRSVGDEVARAVAAGNARLSRVEQIKRYVIIEGGWAPGSLELTPTSKLRRRAIAERYADQIERLYLPAAAR